MEAVMYRSSSDQQISPNKNYFRSSMKMMNRASLIPRFSEDFVPAAYLQAGLLQAPVHPPPPPFLSQSFPVFSVHQQQPPLLPLPISNGGYSMNFSQSRTLSCPPNYGRPNNNSKNRSRDPSLTPKKSKQKISKSPKKEDFEKKMKSAKEVVAPLGPDPEHLPKHVVVPKVLSFSSTEKDDDEGDKFSGSVVFTLSPPPSSLPLPTFSLRPKLSCKAEAAGIDTGATDNLCRLLRLR
ncbi:PREDICTED: uncharacterized protein LOC109149222 [Ipomoea nil]|uniref:uncharacterized protein LOC109149222 n=1 Tax=Ipomoea nil TaxID=35883 RepID=UPI0009014DC8|nr:PREDICTED: uncharacterized protein LOC109149222 [Ipomoea nil]